MKSKMADLVKNTNFAPKMQPKSWWNLKRNIPFHELKLAAVCIKYLNWEQTKAMFSNFTTSYFWTIFTLRKQICLFFLSLQIEHFTWIICIFIIPDIIAVNRHNWVYLQIAMQTIFTTNKVLRTLTINQINLYSWWHCDN